MLSKMNIYLVLIKNKIKPNCLMLELNSHDVIGLVQKALNTKHKKLLYTIVIFILIKNICSNKK